MIFRNKVIRNLVLASLLGNALGDSDVFVYIRLFVPMGQRVADVFSKVNLTGGILFYSTGFLVSYLYLRPVDLYLAGDTSEEAAETARRRVLNLPLFVAGFWGVLWAIGGFFFYFGLHLFDPAISRSIAAHVALSVTSGGTVTVFFVYFLLDWANRRWLVGRVFGAEAICGRAGVFQAGIRTKLTLYYLAVVVMPLAIIAGSVYLGIVESGASPLGEGSVLPLTLTLCGWGIMVGFTFAHLISWNITVPILELKRAMEDVESGDLGGSLPVTSTDELGCVREGFNDMVRGLRERDFVKETFGRYVTKQVSEAVLNGRLRLGGETRDVTILLCDIRNFTSMSERMEPAEVVEFLNGYFSRMVDLVIETEGTLDKFIGDAFLAVYGAPLEVPDHPLKAARAAVRMREVLAEYNRDRESRGQQPIHIGISIHTGRVVAGNIGSDKRMEYTVIGDAENLASRIEGLNPRFGTDILVSESTFELIRDKASARAMEPVSVKGKAEMVKVYALDDIAA